MSKRGTEYSRISTMFLCSFKEATNIFLQSGSIYTTCKDVCGLIIANESYP